MIEKQFYTPEEIDAGNMLDGLHPVKRASRAGYVSIKHGGYYEPYNGRFGVGFIHHLPSTKCRGSHDLIYYLKDGTGKHE